MDLTAIVLCKENSMPLVVFDMNQADALVDLAQGRDVGTQIVSEV
jgi:uridylate kinase